MAMRWAMLAVVLAGSVAVGIFAWFGAFVPGDPPPQAAASATISAKHTTASARVSANIGLLDVGWKTAGMVQERLHPGKMPRSSVDGQ